MRSRSVQSVPGKVILIGEHAVLHGRPAIATRVPLRLTMAVALETAQHSDDGHDPRLRDALATAAEAFALDPRRVTIRTRSRLPVGEGLGSSAAFSVALVRALADLSAAAPAGRRVREARQETVRGIERTELLRLATEVEHAFHGRSSGLDVHAVTADGAIWFEPGREPLATQLDVLEPCEVIVGLSGQSRSTATQIDAHTGRYDAVTASVRRIGELTHQARTALATGNTVLLGRTLDFAHTELSALGLSTPALDRMVWLSRQAGALGAKLTGAGRGGAVVALATDRARGGQVLAALRAAGFDAFATRLTGSRPCGPGERDGHQSSGSSNRTPLGSVAKSSTSAPSSSHAART